MTSSVEHWIFQTTAIWDTITLMWRHCNNTTARLKVHPKSYNKHMFLLRLDWSNTDLFTFLTAAVLTLGRLHVCPSTSEALRKDMVKIIRHITTAKHNGPCVYSYGSTVYRFVQIDLRGRNIHDYKWGTCDVAISQQHISHLAKKHIT